MGAVYEAEHLDTNRRVALKILNHSLPTAADRARFLREGQLAASINHPNSVYVFATEEIAGTLVIVMELATGGTLKDIVGAHGPMAPAAAVDAILQVMDGLEAAAATGVLHRDVKPSNCFLDSHDTIKIGDFGLSLATPTQEETRLTLSGTVLGTPAFAPPEQIRGGSLDVRSDLYSTGATLYYLLTGQPPFTFDDFTIWSESARTYAGPRDAAAVCETLSGVSKCPRPSLRIRPSTAARSKIASSSVCCNPIERTWIAS